jgi:hypothetical protein
MVAAPDRVGQLNPFPPATLRGDWTAAVIVTVTTKQERLGAAATSADGRLGDSRLD